MKKIFLKPLAVMTVVAFSMYGCASSNDNTDTTAMESTTMSETQTMAGDTQMDNNTQMDYDVVADPSDTYTEIFSNVDDPVDYNDMFDDIDDTEKYTAIALLRKSPNHTTLVKLLERANLIQDLERVGEFTLFAPTNEAFAKVPKDKMEKLLMPENKALLSRVLQVHVLPSEVSSMQFNTSQRISLSENGDRYIPIDTDMSGTVVTIGGAKILASDIETSNGIIHVVDNVILPNKDAVEDTGIY